MPSPSLVDIADRKSRQRAILFGVVALMFLAIQIGTHPAFTSGAYAHGWRKYVWAFNAVLLLMLLGGGGGFMNGARLRALINDDVAQSNYRTACKAGFWVAMIVAIGLYVIPAFEPFTGHQASYVIATSATTIALLTFSWLEYRAHRDA